MSNSISGVTNNIQADLKSRSPAQSSGDAQAKQPTALTSTAAPATDNSDKISESTKQLASQVEQEMKKFPAVDSAKVDRLKAQIDAGDYFPDGLEIANKILLMERAIANKSES